VSGTAELLGKRIAGAKDLSSVVRSMKALAASSIVQYQRAVESLRGYAETVESGLSLCLHESGASEPPGARPRAGVCRGAIIFGSDQGLVGRFNESLLEFATSTLAALPGKTTHVWVVGDRMQDLVADSSLPAPITLPAPHSVDAIAPLVSQILIAITKSALHGATSEIYTFHNQPSGEAGYSPASRRLLPLDALWERELLARRWPTKSLPEIAGPIAATLEALIREYLFVLLFQACAQSLAAEHASRLAGMQRAENNIAKIVEELTRIFHRTRQQAIDEELFDVVSGYESLTRIGPPKSRDAATAADSSRGG
jgi:F-type H+-transporting ATPase subunit gamma